MRRYDFITFDCYGTLIDWRSGIAAAFESYARSRGLAFERDAVLDAYIAVEHEVESGSYRSYREVLRETAQRIASQVGWNVSRDDASFLPDSLPSWQPFPDTNAALEKLAGAGCRLGILSNVDRDLFAATSRHFTVSFDAIATAEDVGSYKPAYGHFDRGRRFAEGDRWLHAAQSWFHDIVPATQLGIASAWINRLHEDRGDDGAPVAEFDDLAGFARWMTS